MSFKENLLKKIQIDKLVDYIVSTIGPVDSDKKVDKQAMRKLLEMGPYEFRKERDLELYINKNAPDDKKRILVLDNDLPIYHTSIYDVALRKSPTVKEMVNIKNIIKILNDSDVVKSKKEESLRTIQEECIQQLDLQYNKSDIEKIKDDAKVSLEMADTDGVLESLEIFAELLKLSSPPKVFRIGDVKMFGKIFRSEKGELFYGPIVLYNLGTHDIKLINQKIGSYDKAGLEWLHQIAMGNENPSKEKFEVFDYLADEVLKKQQ